jgi:hypothetical protein
MSIKLEQFDDEVETVRRPGDFKRRGADGPPMVSDPTGATVKSGKRAGEVKWVTYGRPSAAADHIENKTAVEKWTQRELVYGLVAGKNSAAVEDAVNELAKLDRDRDDKTWRAAADRVVVRALDYAEARLAAERGTHTHGTTEAFDRDRDWVAMAEAGINLGIPQHVQAAMVAAWELMLKQTGLKVLATEIAIVHDGWRLAGTGDRIVIATRDLELVDCQGEVVRIPAGTVFVLDIKTGKMRVASDGSIENWHGYAVQIAAYADGIPYDTATDTRQCWTESLPAPSTDVAVIAHLPVAAALAGRAVCTLVAVDLRAGVHAAGLVLQAKDFYARKDVVRASVNHVYEVDVVEPADDPFADLPKADDTPFKARQTQRIVPVHSTPEHELNGGEGPSAPREQIDGLKQRLTALLCGDEKWQAGDTENGVAPKPAAFATLQAIYSAAQAEKPTDYGLSTKKPTRRRVLIQRALLALAEEFGDDLADDHLRCVGLVIADAAQPSVPIHRALLAMNCAEAERFHRVALAVCTGEAVLHIADDGAAIWHADVDKLSAASAA